MHSTPPIQDTLFVNEFRLNAGHWAVAFGILALVMVLTPPFWKHIERFDTGPDYRIPYELSKDYWLYERRLQQLTDTNQIIVLGDSVIWGEYVLPNGTLSHFLGLETGQTNRFVNAGVNGLFPLAEEGLIVNYGGELRGRKILLHFNPLWLSNPKADLQVPQDDFNHAGLVPQFFPRIPAYNADANDRLAAIAERNVQFLSWANHLQDVYFGQKNIVKWTLADDGNNPPHYPNAYKNPLSQITFTVPASSPADSKRGPGSRRHRAWIETGEGPVSFDWVALDSSFQWQAFQRLVTLLVHRANNVCVMVGPFNEHMIAEGNRSAYRPLRDGAVAWLAANHVPHVAPDVLPSALYADASHPLTDGYQLLAHQLADTGTFSAWLKN